MKSDGTYVGRVVHSGGIEEVGAKKFKKRVFAVTDEDPRYPQVIPFEQVGRALDNPAPAVGDTVEVSYQLRGREYGGRYYQSLLCVSVQTIQHAAEPQAQPERPAAEAAATLPAQSNNQAAGDDNLPF